MSYLQQKEPTKSEINRKVINMYGPLLRKNKQYGSEIIKLLNSNRPNSEKKQGLIDVLTKRQKSPHGFAGGFKIKTRRRRSTRYRKRSHKRRT
jgi:hypothetical protein